MTEQLPEEKAVTLTFTENEAEVMLHRLEFLDEVVCGEVFPEDIDPEQAADFASSLVDLIAQHIYGCSDQLVVQPRQVAIFQAPTASLDEK